MSFRRACCGLIPVLIVTGLGCYGDGIMKARIRGAHVTEGIAAQEFADGWAISFERFDVVLASLEVVDAQGRSIVGGAPLPEEAPGFDLAKASDGQEILSDTTAGYPPAKASYRIAPVSPGTESLFVKGTASKNGVKKSFAWMFKTDTRYSDCPLDPKAISFEITLDARELFRVTPGDASSDLVFQPLADADADSDGTITEEELKAAPITPQLPYQPGMSGATQLWQFLEHQTAALGRVDGTRTCATVQTAP